jgi:2-dehydropantoate 2-reductase
MNLLIVGTGALANLFAARFTAADISVTMLGTWPQGLAALNESGVRVVDAEGDEQSYPVRATADPAECAGVRLALVLVKSWQTGRAARQLAQCLHPEGLALTLQNGLGNFETLADALGEARVGAGVTTTGATLLGPGQVRPGGEGVISLGEHPRLSTLATYLSQAGFKAEIVSDLDALVWGKLVVNAAINPLTALLRVPNGELLARPEARQLMADVAVETAAVAEAQGITLPFPDPVAAAEDVARRTASNHASMYQDILRAAPTEIDAICGAIVRVGEQLNTPTPINYTFLQIIKALTYKPMITKS